MSQPKCKFCGAPIVWGLTERKTRVPLDARTHVYKLADANTQLVNGCRPVLRAGESYLVPHNMLCKRILQEHPRVTVMSAALNSACEQMEGKHGKT